MQPTFSSVLTWTKIVVYRFNFEMHPDVCFMGVVWKYLCWLPLPCLTYFTLQLYHIMADDQMNQQYGIISVTSSEFIWQHMWGTSLAPACNGLLLIATRPLFEPVTTYWLFWAYCSQLQLGLYLDLLLTGVWYINWVTNYPCHKYIYIYIYIYYCFLCKRDVK